MDNNNLKVLYDNLKKSTPGFSADYDSFASAMQDENNRKNLYGNLKKSNSAFTASYDDFNPTCRDYPVSLCISITAVLSGSILSTTDFFLRNGASFIFRAA